MRFQAIIWEKVENIGIITLNRPDRFNAVNDQMSEELLSVIEGLNKDDAVGALIITGTAIRHSAPVVISGRIPMP